MRQDAVIKITKRSRVRASFSFRCPVCRRPILIGSVCLREVIERAGLQDQVRFIHKGCA